MEILADPSRGVSEQTPRTLKYGNAISWSGLLFIWKLAPHMLKPVPSREWVLTMGQEVTVHCRCPPWSGYHHIHQAIKLGSLNSNSSYNENTILRLRPNRCRGQQQFTQTDGPNPQATYLYDMDVSLLAHTHDFMGSLFQEANVEEQEIGYNPWVGLFDRLVRDKNGRYFTTFLLSCGPEGQWWENILPILREIHLSSLLNVGTCDRR